MRRFGQAQVPSMWPLIIPPLALIALIAIQFGVQFATAKASISNSVFFEVNLLTMFLFIPLYTFAIFYPLFWMYRYCQAVEGATGGRLLARSSYVMYILGWLFGIPYIIFQYQVQDAFNKAQLMQTGNYHGQTLNGPAITSKVNNSGPFIQK